MKIAFLVSGPKVPSTRFRVLQFLPHLRARGHACTVYPSRPSKYSSYPGLGKRLSAFLRRAHRLRQLACIEAGGFDVVFIERELFADDTWDVEAKLRAVAPVLVLDIDDAIHLRHPAKVARLEAMADLVIAGNSELASSALRHNPRVVEIPTCVDLQRYRPKNDSEYRTGRGADEPLVAGWTGTASNLRYLEAVQEPLARLASHRPLELRLIAERSGPLRTLDFGAARVRFVRWRAASELDELRRLDVGLMPMPDTEWTRSKCGFKLIQYMALGIPAIASPVGVNPEILADGGGWLAGSPEAWSEALASVDEHPERWAELGREGREAVAARYSTEGVLPRLIEALAATRR